MKRTQSRRRRGVIMLMFGVMMMFVIFPVVGLAIDMGVTYAAKARIQSASDGAVIAATRSLNRGLNMASRQAAATETANRFFTANLQSGFTGLSNPVVNVSFPSGAPKSTTVQVNISVDISTYFLRVLGKNTMTVHTQSAATRRDVNIMIVLDRSGSLAASGSCEPMKEAAKAFVQTFQEGNDKVGLVTFGTSYNVDMLLRPDFRTNGTDIVTVIDNIYCNGYTNSAAAYSLAYDQLVAANESGVLNAILFFTDGQPNTITMPRILMQTSSGSCTSKGNRFGVITSGGGIFAAQAPSLPPVNPDSTYISNAAACVFGDLTALALEANGLTRATADGNTGNSTGDDGNSQGGASQGHGYGPHGSGHRWDNWPADWDAFGNSLFGYMPVTQDGSGRITLDSTSVLDAGINALANAGARVRTDSTARGLDVVTYVIGLGNFTGAPQLDLLNRVANTPASPVHDPTQPIGLMIYASDAGQLEAAFAAVGSEMLRLSM